jgi:hypothetical protein
VENPVPLTVEDADRVVNAPVPAVPLPIAPGAANVAPPRDEAFRLATLVVDVTVNGAVPIATVDTNAGAEILLLDVIALVLVPATAGQVRVAVPLVDPLPVIMQAVVPVTPQFSAVSLSVVNVAVEAVPLPIAPGVANVAPFRDEAFRLGTLVVLVTVSGGVPIATVDMSAGAERLLLATIAFVDVPATAGQVKVAVPLVDPCPVITQDSDPDVPQVSAVSVIDPASTRLPPELNVEVADGVWRVVVPPPVTSAVLVRAPAPTTVTVPVPAGVEHAPAPLRNVDELHVPVHKEITSLLAASVNAPVRVVFFMMPVPRVARLMLDDPRVIVAVFATPLPPLAAESGVLREITVPVTTIGAVPV